MVTTDARRNATRTCVDARGLVTRVIDQLGNVTTFQYDTAFNLRRVALPPGRTGNVLSATHDRWGRLTTQDDSATSFTRYFYDDIGNLLEIARHADSATTSATSKIGFVYDGLDRLVHERLDRNDPATTKATYWYDEDSLTTPKPPDEPVLRVTEDDLVRVRFTTFRARTLREGADLKPRSRPPPDEGDSAVHPLP